MLTLTRLLPGKRLNQPRIMVVPSLGGAHCFARAKRAQCKPKMLLPPLSLRFSGISPRCGVGLFPLALVHSPFQHSKMSDALPHVTGAASVALGGAQRPALAPTLAPRHCVKRFSISAHMPFIILGVMCHRAWTPSPAKGGDPQRWSYTCFLLFFWFSRHGLCKPSRQFLEARAT
jgi:hypothetical protein